MGITQKDIAKDLNVSLITVHRALNNTGYVSRELKGRILDYAKERNYVPHKASQVLVRNESRRIDVFSSSNPAYFWDDIAKGIAIAYDQIRPFDYEVKYHRIPDRNTKLYIEKFRKALDDGMNAAAFVSQSIFDMAELFRLVDDAGLPYATFNVDAPESKRVCHIGPDYVEGGRLAAEYVAKTLLFKDDPRVLLISAETKSISAADSFGINERRLKGFMDVMATQYPRIACELRYMDSSVRSGGTEAQFRTLLKDAAGPFDAIYHIPALNTQFVDVLERLGVSNKTVVLHDLDPASNHYLETGLVSAVVYQNPILQGYLVVKTLEHILESGEPPESSRVEIVHNIVLNENKRLYKNYHLFTDIVE